MRNKILRTLAVLFTLGLAAPALAAETLAVSTVNLNMRAGPGTQYPVVAVVPPGARIDVHGCVSGYSWCDVNFGVSRGWVAAAYLEFHYLGKPVVLTPVVAPRIGVNVVVFNRAYWNRYYVDRPFYRHWNVYVVR